MKEISFTKMDFNLVQFGIKNNHKPNNGEKNSVLNSFHCVKSVRIRGYSGPNLLYLFRILRISPYSVRMGEDADQNNCEYGHFLRSERQS